MGKGSYGCKKIDTILQQYYTVISHTFWWCLVQYFLVLKNIEAELFLTWQQNGRSSSSWMYFIVKLWKYAIFFIVLGLYAGM